MDLIKPFGEILITGPTGSGKSTTLAAVLREINDEEINIVTLEDPIEYYVEGDIIQTRYGSGRHEGGYFIGKLEHHRNEPENIVEAYGYTLNTITGCLRIPGREEPVVLTTLQTQYMEHFFAVGYSSRNELWKKFHPNSEIRSVDVVIKRLRQNIGKDSAGNDIIQTRVGSGGYDGGYFIGKLEHHRNEPENIVDIYGHKLSVLTGFLRLLDRKEPVFLTSLQTKYIEHLFHAGPATNERLRNEFHPNTTSASVKTFIQHLNKGIGKDSDGNHFLKGDFNHRLGNFAYYININYGTGK